MNTIVLILALVSLPAFGQDCVHCAALDTFARLLPSPLAAPLRKLMEPLIPIEQPVLRTNPAAKQCYRNESMVDTIVFHHSSSSPAQSIQTINEGHLNRYSPGDPWHMIGYHYTINAPYAGTSGAIKVSQGRPFNLSGAHVGSDSYASMSTSTRDLLAKNNSVVCGSPGRPYAVPDDRFNAQGQGKGNYTTVGVVIIGNYAQRSASNISGYPVGKPRYPSDATIEAAGKLACELQRRHPRITKMSWHNAWKQTACPGTVKARIEQIKVVARRFGCTF